MDFSSGSKRHYFGIEEKNRFVKRFKLLLRSGQTYSIPYSLLPIISLTSKAEILIVSRDVEIKIKGKNLKILEEQMTLEQVTWIRESETEIDDEESEVFISEIIVEGELIN